MAAFISSSAFELPVTLLVCDVRRVDKTTSCLIDLHSLVHVQPYELRLVQLLPQSHFHPQVVVDEEAH